MLHIYIVDITPYHQELNARESEKNDSVTGSSSSNNNSVNETSLFEETGDEIGSLAENENENEHETNDEEVFNNLSEE